MPLIKVSFVTFQFKTSILGSDSGQTLATQVQFSTNCAKILHCKILWTRVSETLILLDFTLKWYVSIDWLNYGTNSLIWLAERQSIRRHTDRRMDWTTHHNKQHCNSIKFHRILFYLCRYTIMLLLTEISVHTRNICSDVRTNISSYGPPARLIVLIAN